MSIPKMFTTPPRGADSEKYDLSPSPLHTFLALSHKHYTVKSRIVIIHLTKKGSL
jgi:hypothetical protein